MRALPAKIAVWWIVVRGRWLNTAAVWAILLILLGIYLVLRQVDVPDSGAALWAPAAAALVAVLLLWRAARTSEAPVPQPVRGSKLAYRVFALIVLTYLGGAVVSGFVGAFVPAAAPGSAPDHTVAIQLRLSTTVQLPVALILSLGVGRLSATWLAVRRPLRWLALVAVTPTLFTVALHPVGRRAGPLSGCHTST